MRTWARENGYDVSDRGRVPADVQEAYASANGKTAAKKAPARKAATKTAAKKAAAKPPAKTAKAAPAPEPTPASQRPEPRPKPSPVTDDRRLVALGEEIAALSERVAKLEKHLSGGKSGSKSPRFLRR